MTLNPGDNTELAVFTGYRRAFAEATYRLGQQRHYGDRYHGSLQGNYAGIDDDSETMQVYHRLTIGLDTIQAFQRRQFVYPFIAAISAQRPLAGRNVPRDAYYEFSLTGFFSAGSSRR